MTHITVVLDTTRANEEGNLVVLNFEDVSHVYKQPKTSDHASIRASILTL
jgi:hypothetical protein